MLVACMDVHLITLEDYILRPYFVAAGHPEYVWLRSEHVYFRRNKFESSSLDEE